MYDIKYLIHAQNSIHDIIWRRVYLNLEWSVIIV